MYVAGVDVSTKAIDLVLVPVEDGPPVWHHYPLTGTDAWERTRSIPSAMPDRASTFYDTVVAIGVENPAGLHGAHAVQRAVGAVLACLPPLTLVQPWRPSEWRKAVGLPGNCGKAHVMQHADLHRGYYGDSSHWPQDACDALCIAVATRNALEKQAA